MEMVNVNGELGVNVDKWMIEKRRSWPCTITIPPSKICTTSANSDPLWIPIIEDDSTARVLREGAVGDDVTWVITKGAMSVQAVVGEVPEVVAKRTVVVHATVLRVAGGVLAAGRALVLQAVDTQMPCDMAVKTISLVSCC